VITHLTTNWVTETVADAIALPTIREGFLGYAKTDGNTILVGWDQMSLEYTDLSVVNDKLDNIFEIVIFAEHRTEATAKSDLLKMVSQVRRHENRAITNGEWHLDTIIPSKFNNNQIFICTLRQTLYVGD